MSGSRLLTEKLGGGKITQTHILSRHTNDFNRKLSEKCHCFGFSADSVMLSPELQLSSAADP